MTAEAIHHRHHGDRDELLYKSLLESAPAYFYVADPSDYSTLYRSPQAAPMLGYSMDEWSTNPDLWVQILHPDDRERVTAEFAACAQGRALFQAEYRLFAKAGDIRWVRDHAALVQDPSGGGLVVQGVVLDITAEVEARLAVEVSLAETLTLLETAQSVGRVGTFVAWLTPERKGEDTWSKSCLAIFGYDEASHAGSNESFWKRVHPEDLEMVRAVQGEALEKGTFYDLVHRIIRPNGEMRWIRERAQVERAPDGSPIRLIGVTLDITEERGLEEALAKAESESEAKTQFYEGVFERAPLGVAKVDIQLRVLDANARLHEILKMAPGSLDGTSVADFLDADAMAQVMEEFKPLWVGTVDRVESAANATRGDGVKVWLHWTATAARNRKGRVEYFLAMFEDVTAKREIEVASLNTLAALERLNHLKSEFVSVVSHEFRTALTGIQGFSEIIRDEVLTGAEVKEFANDIHNDAMRLNRMITEMLDLDRIEAGRTRLRLAMTDLNLLITEAVDRVASSTDRHQLESDLDPSLPIVHCDADRVLQVVTNLLTNAVKYSPAGGHVLVSSRHDPGFVTISVRDHGLGLAASFIDKVFDRYERYADNATDQIVGTGLGLPIARQIVEMHGGKIGVESVHGEGSNFHFTLPLVARPGGGDSRQQDGEPAIVA
jgi:PAS domain S-box-containing protein